MQNLGRKLGRITTIVPKLGVMLGEVKVHIGKISVDYRPRLAREVLWQHLCFPSNEGGFDSRNPLHKMTPIP